MASTVVLITGVNRGIGYSLAAQYLKKPNHTVIGSVRDSKAPKSQEVNNLPKADGSKLILVTIENTSTTDPKKAIEEVTAAGIDHIDIVISSAGISHDPSPLDVVDVKLINEAFQVNTVSTILLFQATLPLLTKSSNPKWVSVSSLAGSVAGTHAFNNFVGPYGISKAGQNWFTATVHHAFPALTVLALHPGFVSSDLGNAIATNAKIPPPPTTPDESAKKLIQFVETATRDNFSGKFYDSETGKEIPW